MKLFFLAQLHWACEIPFGYCLKRGSGIRLRVQGGVALSLPSLTSFRSYAMQYGSPLSPAQDTLLPYMIRGSQIFVLDMHVDDVGQAMHALRFILEMLEHRWLRLTFFIKRGM
jgi:hypothetical protein